MAISPAYALLIAGGVSAVGVGLASNKVLDGIAERNPTGSAADGKALAVSLLTGLGGAALGAVALWKGGGSTWGPIAAGVGGGAVLGAIGAHIAFRIKHGVGVDTTVSSVFGTYNRDFDDVLDLNPRWRTPEFIRRNEWDHDHGDYQHRHVDYYSIQRLAFAADADHDQQVTRPELRTLVGSLDRNGDGRLKGAEHSEYSRRYGEESWWGNWIF